jgi:uncharacterized membrane protein
MLDQRINKAQKTILLLFVVVVLATPIAITVAVRKTFAAMTRTAPAASAPSVGQRESDAERQAKAWKAYNDYEYVKRTGPITGPMYSTKW